MAEHLGEPLRVGIIGYGLAGRVFHAPLADSTPGMRVAAIVTGDSDRQAQARLDYPEAAILADAAALFADPAALDLVVVAAPNREAGLPVVVDKPMAPSSVGARQLIEAAERSGKLLTVFQNRRWDNDFLTARRLIEAGALGALVRLESRFERYQPELKAGAWRERAAPEEAGGLLFDLGAHLIDQAILLFGPPDSIYAEAAARRQGAQVDDDSFVALHFAGGQIAHLWMSVIPRKLGPRLRLVGLRGVYEKYGLDPQEGDLAQGLRPGDTGWGTEPRECWGRVYTDIGGVAVEAEAESMPGSYEHFYAQVRDALTRGAPLPVYPADSLRVLRVIEAAHESARTGATVTFPG